MKFMAHQTISIGDQFVSTEQVTQARAGVDWATLRAELEATRTTFHTFVNSLAQSS